MVAVLSGKVERSVSVGILLLEDAVVALGEAVHPRDDAVFCCRKKVGFRCVLDGGVDSTLKEEREVS